MHTDGRRPGESGYDYFRRKRAGFHQRRREELARRAALRPRVELVDPVDQPVFIAPRAGSSSYWHLAARPASMIGAHAYDRLAVTVAGETRDLDLHDRTHREWLNAAMAPGSTVEVAGLGPLLVIDETIVATVAGVKLIRALRRAGVRVWLHSWDNLILWADWYEGQPTRSLERHVVARLQSSVRRSNVQDAHRAADGVIAASRYLADVLAERGICRQVVSLPLSVDPAEVRSTPREPQDRVHIGFAGSAGKFRNGDLAPVLPTLWDLTADPRCQVHLWNMPGMPVSGAFRLGEDMRLDPDGERLLHVHLDPGSYEAYRDSHAALDIALAPLRADGVVGAFNRNRAPSKALEHGAHGSALVLADMEPYADLEHGVHCLKASTAAEWRAAMLALVNDDELRLRLGEGARRYVLEHHATEVIAPLWHQWYQDVMEGARP